MEVNEVTCKSVLVASKLPEADYVVNPYTGCTFACAYCYASFMGRFVGQPVEAWGKYLTVKINAVDAFQTDLRRLMARRQDATILLSSVTDAWQGPEKKYRLAQGILRTLVDAQYTGQVSMLTKSPLITRDIGLISQLSDKEVGVTVTTTDDTVGRLLEAHAPLAQDRLKTLKNLNRRGIPTYAFVGPLLPHYRYRTDQLETLFRSLADVGTTTIFAEHLNSSAYIWKRIAPQLSELEPESREVYTGAKNRQHKEVLAELVLALVKKYGFNLRLGRVIDHAKKR